MASLPSAPQDEARSQLATLSHQLADVEAQRDATGAQVQQLQKQLAECHEGTSVCARVWATRGWNCLTGKNIDTFVAISVVREKDTA